MADRPTNPYAGLDKALLRSTNQAPITEVQVVPPAEPARHNSAASLPPVPDDTTTVDARVHARTGADTPARTQTHALGTSTIPLAETLFRALAAKQHLVSSTFRFQGQELAELDEVSAAVAKRTGRRVSKNDLVRLSLTWLLTDFRRGTDSVLAQVLERL